MKAVIQIKDTVAVYEDGEWSCKDSALLEKLNALPLGNYPASEPDPEGRDLELAVALLGAVIIERTYDDCDLGLVY